MSKKIAKKNRKKSTRKSSKKSTPTESQKGRPVGTGKYGCTTSAIRVPVHLISEVQGYIVKKLKHAARSRKKG
ncbi:MAG: hypothetical protein LBQ66_11465 [Planctomycetaceae bacterium]|jgi:hypothetical protein|nr:hypothetical protein [Planctomycetaceae bacterium]